MSRTLHTDREMKLPKDVRDALKDWLKDNGWDRAALCDPLATHQTQVARIFSGVGYISATQRRALEKFTGGVFTVRMLEGKEKPPKVAVAPAPEPPPPPSADVQAPEDIAAVLVKLAPTAKAALVSALRDAGILPWPDGQFRPAKSEALRQRCREWVFAEIAGKPTAREKSEERAEPVLEAELQAKLEAIEARLMAGEADGLTEGSGI